MYVYISFIYTYINMYIHAYDTHIYSVRGSMAAAACPKFSKGSGLVHLSHEGTIKSTFERMCVPLFGSICFCLCEHALALANTLATHKQHLFGSICFCLCEHALALANTLATHKQHLFGSICFCLCEHALPAIFKRLSLDESLLYMCVCVCVCV